MTPLHWLTDTRLLTINEYVVTPLTIANVGLIVVSAWLLSRLAQRGLKRLSARSQPQFRPALYTLGRLLHYAVLLVAFLVALSAIGVDISRLTLFMSALGIGLGFGLQQIVNNFVSGLILLLEQSIKVGDFIELGGGQRGEVQEISIRSTRITTNDNIDIILPNSVLVGDKVINWTLRDVVRRLRVPFGVAYGSDKELVKKAGLEAAASVPFTLAEPASRGPQVWLVGFGDSNLNFELVVWLTPDAVKRPAAVSAAYCWALETALRRHGIEIPFPQRDLHVRSVLGFDEPEALRQALEHGRRAAEPVPATHSLSAAERAELSSNDALEDALAPTSSRSAPRADAEEPRRR
jgi:small-conductance mechanosensitive channel